jgi:hypothetical protein
VVFKGFIAAAVSVALMATPAVASAAETAATTARAATTQVALASENVDGSELRGGFIIPLIAIVAVILGILAATKNKKTRTSP